jgi:hypothetical protein
MAVKYFLNGYEFSNNFTICQSKSVAVYLEGRERICQGRSGIKKGLTEKVKPFIDTGSINACQL